MTGGALLELILISMGWLFFLGGLAANYQARGDTVESERLYQLALTLKEKLLGRNHPDVATTLNNLAAVYKSQGRYAEAEPIYRRAATIFEAALGLAHPKAATCRRNYEALLRPTRRPL